MKVSCAAPAAVPKAAPTAAPTAFPTPFCPTDEVAKPTYGDPSFVGWPPSGTTGNWRLVFCGYEFNLGPKEHRLPCCLSVLLLL